MLTGTSSATAANSSTSKGSSAASSMEAQQDRFLKLLVAQLNNQDPMNPLDNAQMTSQMAQMSTVTGIEQVNATLKSMAEQFNALQMLQGSSMVGHNVMIDSNTLTPIDGKAVGAIDLTDRADNVKVEILSPGGQVLDTINAGALAAGRHYFDWDASSYKDTGNPTFRITATQGGKAVDAKALARDKVVSVGLENGAMNIQLLGRGTTAYSNIKAIL
ncbi:flagellar hook capping FlgD N-terminal domain-containing protein [Rhodoferax sp.]|uniref:flagellar hook assembly protein FlgD n=1 Tax=Rhodoferax sp. TaxID=50421 RepID=UPI002602175D|nr:flagellar hook capping FlgD N-terminal domain-containing protein [Rhodoferax sp.]MDD2925684.1 flagellar hook capping FlgD N-terminal domain-containing protein [Rhodoferax sp.]